MVFTTYGRERTALALGSDISNNMISYFALGSGSGTELVTNVTLVNEFTRFGLLGSPDFTQSRKVRFVGDIGAVTSSGLILREWGMLASGPALIGSLWARQAVNGSIVFDGTLEGRFEMVVEVM